MLKSLFNIFTMLSIVSSVFLVILYLFNIRFDYVLLKYFGYMILGSTLFMYFVKNEILYLLLIYFWCSFVYTWDGGLPTRLLVEGINRSFL